MKLDESTARQIALAQAIETSDVGGQVLSDIEREQVDTEVGAGIRKPPEGDADMAALLSRRAKLLVERAGRRNPQLVNLLEKPRLERGLRWFAPLLALALGFGIDRVANPHKVDLLSAPFLAILLWNLVVYLLLVVSLVRAGASDKRWSASLWQWWVSRPPRRRRGSDALTGRIVTAFVLRWQALTNALTGQRLRVVLHLMAAGWAAGVVLSLLVRGLFVAYGVGWESTWLSAAKVHAILQVLFAPLTLFLSAEPFSLADIVRLQVDVGEGGTVTDGRRWVLLYAGLLLLVVVLPRSALALWAGLRARWLAAQIQIDLDDPYFQRIIDNLSPAQVRLGVLTHRAADRAALAAVLLASMPRTGSEQPQAPQPLIDTARGDALWWWDLDESGVPQPTAGGDGPDAPASAAAAAWPGRWLARLRGGPPQLHAPTVALPDLVLHVVGQAGDLAGALPKLQALRRPVLMLVRADPPDEGRQALLAQSYLHQRSHELPMDVLDFEEFAGCWVLDPVLLGAVAPRLPRSRAQGYARLVAAWQRRNGERLSASAQAMGEALQASARERVEIARLPLLDRASTVKRRQHEATRKAAMAQVLSRVADHNQQLLLQLLSLHGLGPEIADELVFHAEAPSFDETGGLDSRSAAAAGAASGAAMGASIDLVTGGLTLGAATALGALAGGGAAFMGVLWNNRDAPKDRVRMALSEEMLLALAQACLLRYLSVIHARHSEQDLGRAAQLEWWKDEARQQVALHRKVLSRSLQEEAKAEGESLADLLEQMAAQILQHLYPAILARPPA